MRVLTDRVVRQAQHMFQFVPHDGQEVHGLRISDWGLRIGDGREFLVGQWRRVDEPAVAGGGDVDGDAGASATRATLPASLLMAIMLLAMRWFKTKILKIDESACVA